MTPSWINEYAQDCRSLLGIGDDWQITISMTDKPDGDSENGGAAHINAQYLNAVVEVHTKYQEPSEEGRQLILHEMMHVSLANYRMVIDQLFFTMPEHMQTLGRIMISQAEEQYIQRSSRALLRTIKPEGEQ